MSQVQTELLRNFDRHVGFRIAIKGVWRWRARESLNRETKGVRDRRYVGKRRDSLRVFARSGFVEVFFVRSSFVGVSRISRQTLNP